MAKRVCGRTLGESSTKGGGGGGGGGGHSLSLPTPGSWRSDCLPASARLLGAAGDRYKFTERAGGRAQFFMRMAYW